MFKEKLAGFKYLFSDHELRGSSIITFLLAIFLVSAQYLYGYVPNNYIYLIGICAYVDFQYLFLAFILFNIWRMFGAFRDKRNKKLDKRNLWVIRLLAIGILVITDVYFVLFSLAINVYLLLFSFIAWSAIEAFFLCKLAAGLASFSRHAGIRLLVYILLAGIFLVYLIYSFYHALNTVTTVSPSTLVFGFENSAFDLCLTLVMFLFSLASMGERFLPENKSDKLDFHQISGKQGAKIRSTVIFLLFILIGFEFVVRGFNFVAIQASFTELGSVFYYGLKLVFFVPFSIGFLIAVIVKRIGKKAEKLPKT
jgi:hypothetical protein